MSSDLAEANYQKWLFQNLGPASASRCPRSSVAGYVFPSDMFPAEQASYHDNAPFHMSNTHTFQLSTTLSIALYTQRGNTAAKNA